MLDVQDNIKTYTYTFNINFYSAILVLKIFVSEKKNYPHSPGNEIYKEEYINEFFNKIVYHFLYFEKKKKKKYTSSGFLKKQC